MDKLKQFLQEHADEMQFDNPPERVWQNIRANTANKKQGMVLPMRLMRWAAAACVATLAIIGAYTLLKPKNDIAVATNNTKTDTQPRIIFVDDDSNESAPKKLQPNEVAATEVNQPTTKKAPVVGISKSIEPVVEDKKPSKALVAKQTAPAQPRKNNTAEQLKEGQQMVWNGLSEQYAKVVSNELKTVNNTAILKENADYFGDFKQQWAALKVEEKAIDEDFRKEGFSDDLLQRMIDMNQSRVQLLKTLQTEIKKTNNLIKGKQPDAKVTYLNL
jgi:hypothetical protein